MIVDRTISFMSPSVMLWSTETGKQITASQGHTDRVSKLEFTPDGKRIVSASWDSMIKLWDGNTGNEIAALKGGKVLWTHFDISPDGRKVVSPSDDNTFRL